MVVATRGTRGPGKLPRAKRTTRPVVRFVATPAARKVACKVDRTRKGRNSKKLRVAAQRKQARSRSGTQRVELVKGVNDTDTAYTAGVIRGMALKVRRTQRASGGDEGANETGGGDTETTCLQEQGCDGDRSTSTQRRHSTPMDRDEALELLLYFLKNR